MDSEWASYWRATDRPLEAMHAHFTQHRYHRHSHETYSFGVTEEGAQAFRCRGGGHTSAAGMVIAFNPDEPHDGYAATELGFTYRIVHIGPELVTDHLAEVIGRFSAPPLFAEPVVHDAVLATALRRLHSGLLDGSALRRDELLSAALTAMVGRATTRPLRSKPLPRGDRHAAEVVRELLDARYADDLGAHDLAAATGSTRFAVYRAFHARYGMAPSDYQRQCRLRVARELLAQGRTAADAAVEAGFADQAHLTRWFGRYYGITPGTYRKSVDRRR
jgi:AraC-like DNA-binding protein